MCPRAGFFGLLLAVRGQRRGGYILLGTSTVLFVLIVTRIIPSFNEGQFSYGSAYGQFLERPWQIPATLVTPPIKLKTAMLWVLPFLFVPLLSPQALLLIPFVLSRFLSTSPNHWGAVFHYSAPIAPIVAMGAGDGLTRIAEHMTPERRQLLIRAACALTVVLCAVLPGNQPLFDVFSPKHYRRADFHAAGYRAIAGIPSDASVVAMAEIVPHLSRRRAIFILRPGR